MYILKPSRRVSSVKVWAAGDWEWKAQFVSWQRPDPSACPWTRPQQAHTHIYMYSHIQIYYTNILYTFHPFSSTFIKDEWDWKSLDASLLRALLCGANKRTQCPSEFHLSPPRPTFVCPSHAPQVTTSLIKHNLILWFLRVPSSS